MSIGADAAGTRLYDAVTIAAHTALDTFCYYVLATGEIVQASADVGSVLVFEIDGDQIA